MAVFGKRPKRTSRRALRKAHTKALKARAQAEKKFHAKASRKTAKATRKAEELAARTARKASRGRRGAQASAASAVAATTSGVSELSGRAQKKARKAEIKHRRNKATASVRSYLGVARLLVPVLAPFGYQAATLVRGQLDARRARAIGVGVEQLGEFSGHGAALSARIAGLEPALAEMESTHLAPADVEYRTATTARLAELTTAVHAAERMPTPRRKAAHRSIAADLDRIDAELLQKLGVR